MKNPFIHPACFLAAATGLVGAPAATGAEEAADVSAATVPGGEKPHSLFMGVDIAVEFDKTFHRVRDVSRSSWVITVNNRPEFIPTVRRALNLRVDQSLKLTQRRARVIDFKAERTYTMANDPKQQALHSQVALSALTTEQTMIAERELSRAIEAKSWGGGFAAPPRDNPFDSGPQAGPNQQREELALIDQQERNSVALGQLTGRSFHAEIAEEQARRENFDALAVEFEVASDTVLRNPYLVVIAQFREKDAAPKFARNWIYAESLDPIDEKPRKVRLLHGGFPLGYTLDKAEVHIYSEGAEVATNLSPKHVPLTSDEAFQYLVIDHIASNKGKTVPAAPAMVSLPAEIKTRLAEGQGQQVYYVKVSKDGTVTEAYEDEDYARKVADPFFANAVKGILFKPALEAGKPVEGRTKIDVAKLQI